MSKPEFVAPEFVATLKSMVNMNRLLAATIREIPKDENASEVACLLYFDNDTQVKISATEGESLIGFVHELNRQAKQATSV